MWLRDIGTCNYSATEVASSGVYHRGMFLIGQTSLALSQHDAIVVMTRGSSQRGLHPTSSHPCAHLHCNFYSLPWAGFRAYVLKVPVVTTTIDCLLVVSPRSRRRYLGVMISPTTDIDSGIGLSYCTYFRRRSESSSLFYTSFFLVKGQQSVPPTSALVFFPAGLL